MRKKFYWDTESLIVLGLFTALNKVISLLIALIGGGMNPITLLLKNGVATALLILMVSRVRRFGVLALYTLIAQMVSFLIAGGGMITLLPAFLLAGLLSDGVISLFGGYKKLGAVVAGVAMYDLLGRTISLVFSFLTIRESMGMFVFGAVIVVFGYLGCLLVGIPCGIKLTKELRHAGIIREL